MFLTVGIIGQASGFFMFWRNRGDYIRGFSLLVSTLTEVMSVALVLQSRGRGQVRASRFDWSAGTRHSEVRHIRYTWLRLFTFCFCVILSFERKLCGFDTCKQM